MSHYFKKELADSPIYIFGQPLRFDLMMTEDAALAGELSNAARRGVGGIIVLNKEQFEEEVKKKDSETALGNNSNRRQWRTELSALSQRSPVAVAGSFARPQEPQIQITPPPHKGAMPEPLSVPSPEAIKIPTPPTAKAGNILK